MKYNFPATRFSEFNSAKIQFMHICSELEEAKAAFDAGDHDHGDEELVDLFHSLETYFRIRSAGRERGYVNKLFCDVERKNRVRGYYS